MDRICQYSTIIFAGNMSVLLFVSIMTDYWEYRGFEVDKIIKNLTKKSNTEISFPPHTNTCFILNHHWYHKSDPKVPKERIQKVTYYQPPAMLHRYHYMSNITISQISFNGTHNVSSDVNITKKVQHEDELILYTEYGNLFRNCDDLEADVREELELIAHERERCFNFIVRLRERDFIARELPAVIHLDRAAFSFGVMCLISSVVSVIAGGYGSLAQDEQAIVAASSSALASAMTLTICIALFHGKCHLMHRREFLQNIDIAHKNVISEARVHYYGWSFILAWICIVLCFIHTWVWLLKAQNIPEKFRLRSRSRNHRRDPIEYSHDNSAMMTE